MAEPKIKTPPNLLNAEQLGLFHTYMQRWQNKLGLTGWRVERSKKKTKNMAMVEMDNGAKLAAYRVGDFGAAEINPMTMEKTALHEMLHVLLYNLVYQVENELSDEAVLAEEHSVINTLEKLLCPETTP